MPESPWTALIARCAAALVALAAGSGDLRADFIRTATITLTSPGAHHGIAFDGTQWHIANALSSTFHNYDAAFTYLGDTPVAGVTDMRGLTYDPITGTLFISNLSPAVVRQVTLGGSTLNMFSGAAGLLNALAYDPVTDTLWLAYFTGGLIENRTRTGTLLSSFNAPFEWTGLAIDPTNRTLLVLETRDFVLEYRLDGTLIGTAIPTGRIVGDGQGLAYDPATGTLYVTTTQDPGIVNVFNDPTRAVVPEPAGALLFAVGVIGIASIHGYRHGIRKG